MWASLGRLFTICGDFVAVALGHVDIRQHDIRRIRIEAVDCELSVSNRGHFDVFVGERQLDDALNRDAVVGQEEFMRHPQSNQSWVLSVRWADSLSVSLARAGRSPPRRE